MEAEIDYMKEAKKSVYELFYEPWMDNEDWAEIEKKIIESLGGSYEKIGEALKKGVENGIPIKVQLKISKVALKLIEEEPEIAKLMEALAKKESEKEAEL